jgi:ArsR family metal-binding transcriptional regulator
MTPELTQLSSRTVKTKFGDLDISMLSNGDMIIGIYEESIAVTKHITKDQAKQFAQNIVDAITESEETSDDYFKVKE